MPQRERSLGKLVLGSAMEMPSTTMSPFWKGSSALTVLMSVDLPDPDGPHTTTTSPLLIPTEQSVSTCTGPYHLETFWISIMAGSLANDGDLALQLLDQPGQAVADDEIEHG